MRLFLLLIFMAATQIGYSQTSQFCIGKFYNEVQQYGTQPSSFQGRRALFKIVDSTAVIYYVFNNDICTEFNSMMKSSKPKMDSIMNSVREYFTFESQIRLNASVKRIDSNLYNLVIRNE